MYTIEEFDKEKTKVLKYILYKKRSENEIRTKFSGTMDENLLEDIIEYGDTVLILNKNKKFINGNPRDLLFSKETLNNYGLKEPEIYKYIEELKKFGVKDIDNIKTNSELIKKLFYNN